MTPALHLVLVGPMGVGKTTVGSLVSAATGMPLVDSDQVLAREGVLAADVARERGVAALHERECRQLRAALEAPVASVVAAAASTVEAPTCRDALARHVVAWLRASPEVVARRAEVGAHRRDLGPDPLRAQRALAARRDPLYAAVADVVVDVGACTAAEASRELVDAYEAMVAARFGPGGRG